MVDFFLVRLVPFFFLALILFTNEFLTPSLFFFVPAFFFTDLFAVRFFEEDFVAVFADFVGAFFREEAFFLTAVFLAIVPFNALFCKRHAVALFNHI